MSQVIGCTVKILLNQEEADPSKEIKFYRRSRINECIYKEIDRWILFFQIEEYIFKKEKKYLHLQNLRKLPSIPSTFKKKNTETLFYL